MFLAFMLSRHRNYSTYEKYMSHIVSITRKNINDIHMVCYSFGMFNLFAVASRRIYYHSVNNKPVSFHVMSF